MFSCMQKSISFLPSFSRYYKNITNLDFWVLWACLGMATKDDDLSFKKTLMFIFLEEINFDPSPHSWNIAKILLDYYGYFGHAWLLRYNKMWSQFEENYVLMQKIKFIAQFILQILLRHCKFVILGTLRMPGHTHQK